MKRAVLLPLVGAVWFALNALPAWAQTTFIYHRDIGATITFAWTHDRSCPQTDAAGASAPSTFDAFEFRGIKEGSTTDVRLTGRTNEVQVPHSGSVRRPALLRGARSMPTHGCSQRACLFRLRQLQRPSRCDGRRRGAWLGCGLRPEAPFRSDYREALKLQR